VFGAQLAEYLLCASVTDFTYLDPVINYLLQSETHFYLKISVPTGKVLYSYQRLDRGRRTEQRPAVRQINQKAPTFSLLAELSVRYFVCQSGTFSTDI